MNKDFNIENVKIRKGCKDNFHAYMVKDASFVGKYDFPTIPQNEIRIPLKLISYDHINTIEGKNNYFCHFYIDDYKFDGPNGIWNGSLKEDSKRSFKIEKLKNFAGIIAPDFSLYLDMPRCMQIWNIYRSRAFGYYCFINGIYVIPNVRWTDKESYDYAFDGILENSIVAVGTLGDGKKTINKILFVNGFIELIKRKYPKCVIIYGSIFKELKFVLDEYKVNYIHFNSSINSFYNGYKHGNESQ